MSFLSKMSRCLICSEMVQGVPKFDPFALDKDSPFALGILSNLTNGLEIFSVKDEGFVLVLATSFLESVFVESLFNSCISQKWSGENRYRHYLAW